VKGWVSLSRHRTAEGERGPARPTHRMLRLHSHRAPGRMSEFAAGEPVRPTEQPVRPTDLPARSSDLPARSSDLPARSSDLPARSSEPTVQASEPTAQASELPVQAPEPAARPTDLPVQASELSAQPTDLPVQPSKLPAQVWKLLAQPSELRRLFTTFGYLVAKQGATAALGLAYWAVATHLFSARDVGLAAAASSTAFFLAAIGALGIPLLLLAELESVPASLRRVTFSTGISISCSVVLILSLVTLALSRFLGASLRIIGADSTTAALFVIGAVATMGGLTFDNAAIGLHRGSAQLTRGSLTSLLKLAIVGVLVLAGIRTAPGLLFAWALALVASLVICSRLLRLEPTPAGEGNLSRRVALARRYGSLSLKHHVLNLSINSVSYMIALIAALLISPQQLAYFSTALLLSSTAMIIPYLLALSLFAEISGDLSLLHRHVRRTLPLGLALSCGILVVVEVAAPLVLRIFGPAYAMNGTTPLRIFLLVGPAYVIKDHYVAIRRAQGRMSHAARVMVAGTCTEAAGAALGGIYWGMTGLCIGWAVAAWCEAVALLPAVIRVFRDPPAEPDPGGSSG
jgi:O-antigen/teichoic acid export membrane protein